MRNSKALLLFCAFLALYLLNCSIDTSDLYHDEAQENLTINHQESVAELIIEKILGFESAIPESDDSDSGDNTTLKKSKAVDFFVVPVCVLCIDDFCPQLTSKNIGFSKIMRWQTYFEIHSPPPEV